MSRKARIVLTVVQIVFLSAAVQAKAQFDPWYDEVDIGDCLEFTGSTQSCPSDPPTWCPAFCEEFNPQNPVLHTWMCFNFQLGWVINTQVQPQSDSWDGVDWPSDEGYKVVDNREVYCEITADCECHLDGEVMRCTVNLETENSDPIYVPILDHHLSCEEEEYEG